jgi:Na+-transporting NADH:ubiquinone oxidoreductase subunit B
MKFLRQTLDQVHPLFAHGGRLERLYPLYEALDTFLYTPGEVSGGKTHIRDALDLKRMMIMVVLALIPCVLMACWNTGYQANSALQKMEASDSLPWAYAAYEARLSDGPVPPLPLDPDRTPEQETRELAATPPWQYQVFRGWLGFTANPSSFVGNFLFGLLHFLPVYVVCMTVGGLLEVVFCIVRRHEINEGFLVSGLLFPLTLPPNIPLWQVGLGIAFGIVVGKEIFGGTGRNFLNPALTARAFLYFAYPVQISGAEVWTAIDGFSGATALGVMASTSVETGMSALQAVSMPWGAEPVTWWSAFLGTIQGSMGETSALACVLGAAILIATGIGSWRIMAGCVIGAVALSGIFYAVGSPTNPMFQLPPWWHLVIGGFAFGAVFMATDPVSASMTESGKWAYGILIGAVTILIRVINPAFPEGIMLAILLANVFAPLIDYVVVQANVKRRAARYAA